MLDLSLTPAERFLCEAIRHRDHLNVERLQTLYRQLGDAEAFALCKHNRVASIAADALHQCPDLALPGHWEEAYREMASRISGYLAELDKVAALLQSQDIPIVALKNSGIARALYPHPGASPMGDIDVMVLRRDFRQAHDLLMNAGYQMKFRSPLEEENLELAERGGGAEYSVTLPSGQHLWFELQWRPVAGRWIRPEQEPSGDELMERSLPISGSTARLLAPEDNLLQVALHTAKHTYVRAPGFRLHTDVDRIIRACPIDWGRFTDRVCNLQVKTAVFFSLALARDLIGTPIPDEVMTKIAPSGWKILLMSRWLQKVGLFDPDGRKWGRLGYILFVSLLYDDLKGLMRGIFPDPQTMRQSKEQMGTSFLPLIYLKRIVALVMHRTLVR